MTNKELFAEWGKHLRETYGCRPDENGNYPCDNGMPCDRCSDDSIWKLLQEKISKG